MAVLSCQSRIKAFQFLPLAATTHFSLIAECKNKDIKTEIIHSSSIFSAVGETGLSLYKFGGTTSIPIYDEHFHPESFFEVIEENIKCGKSFK